MDLLNLVDMIGMSPEAVRAIEKADSPEEVEIALKDFKKELRKHRRKVAFKHHPDRGGSDEFLKTVNPIIDKLLSLVVRNKPKRVFVYHNPTWKNSKPNPFMRWEL